MTVAGLPIFSFAVLAATVFSSADLYDLSLSHERSGRLDEAVSVAERVLDIGGETYDAHLRLGWLHLSLEDFSAAEHHYKRAAELVPESEDAWLGLQRARMAMEDWSGAAEAGERVLDLNPDNYWALSRQAYVQYMRGDWDTAETLYRRALEQNENDGEMLLGLGFARVRRGAAEEGHGLCRRAGHYLGDDPRIEECLNLEPARGFVLSGSLFGAYMHYTNPEQLKNIKSITATAGAFWLAGVGVWAGAALAGTAQTGGVDDLLQVNPALGVYLRKKGFAVGGAGTWIFSNDGEVDDTKVVVLGAGYDGDLIGGGVGVSASFYPSLVAVQVDPRFKLHLFDKLHLSAGPELIVHSSQDSGGAGRGARMVTSTSLLWSGHLGIRWLPHRIIAVFARGFVGARSLAVEDEGLTVWSDGDRFAGGYVVGAAVDIGSHFTLTAAFRQQFGVEQQELSRSFSVLGGSLGVLARY